MREKDVSTEKRNISLYRKVDLIYIRLKKQRTFVNQRFCRKIRSFAEEKTETETDSFLLYKRLVTCLNFLNCVILLKR